MFEGIGKIGPWIFLYTYYFSMTLESLNITYFSWQYFHDSLSLFSIVQYGTATKRSIT
jgi:hypothetical protein